MNISADPWVWVAALCSIAVLSSVFKDTRVYQAAEHIFVGSGAGYAISQAYRNIVIQGWRPITDDGRLLLIIPMLLGLLLYSRFIKGYEWLSRWSMSFLVGAGAGISIYGIYNSNLLAQIRATMVPLYVAGDLGATINNCILVIGVISVLLYFLFTVSVKGPLKHLSTFGRVMMMITFGVSFGNVVMGRISLLLGVLETIYGEWLGLIP